MAVWPSGNCNMHYNKVTLHRGQLVLTWVTICIPVMYTALVSTQPPRLTQPSPTFQWDGIDRVKVHPS